MTTRLDLNATYQQVDNGWIQAQLVEIPGVITAAPTLGEAKEQLVDALREFLLALTEPSASSEDCGGESGSLAIVISAA
ncbi:MAG TPA: hypothetical protein VIR57_12465 [Chloroflexota bacterium]|jgi:predicted RNase H-like HicB family nuclease